MRLAGRREPLHSIQFRPPHLLGHSRTLGCYPTQDKHTTTPGTSNGITPKPELVDKSEKQREKERERERPLKGHPDQI